MGQVFSLSSGHSSLRVFVDFDNANVAPEIMQDEVSQITAGLEQALKELEVYEHQKAVRTDAIRDPSPENNRKAVVALIPNITMIKTWSDLANTINQQFPLLLEKLVNLEDQPGLGIAIAKILALIYRCDCAKMSKTEIANDFSGYRRCIDNITDMDLPVSKEECFNFTMFSAETNPFSSAVCRSSDGNPSLNIPARNALTQLANACCGMVNTSKATTPSFCFDVMVSSIILYDMNSRTAQGSVFSSRTLAIKKCIQSIKKHAGESADTLLTSIKYTTLHFKDAPASIERLLE